MKRWALGESLHTLLVSCYCYSKLGQAWFFKTIQIYNLKVLGVRNLEAFLQAALLGNLMFPSFRGPPALLGLRPLPPGSEPVS